MKIPKHHHYADGGIHPGCERCQLEQVAPDLLVFAQRAYYLVEKKGIVDEYLDALRIPLGDLMPTQIVDEAVIVKAIE